MSIKTEKLNYIYSPGTPFSKHAIKDVTLEIPEGKFVALIGHTGSGKSTLIQHFNGLIKPTSGKVFIDGLDITEPGLNLTEIRKKVGLVFQYPEYQLFEETIEKDVAFGPKNLGLSEEEINQRVRRAIELVGLDFEKDKDKSPFELSGGQKRRVAIAGVVAMEPKVLILDEPTAGLDPKGRNEILSQIKSLHKEYGMTTLLVSHSMEDVAEIADLVLVMDKGEFVMMDTPKNVFSKTEELEKMGLASPQVTYLVKALNKSGCYNLKEDIITVEEALEEILKSFKGGDLK